MARRTASSTGLLLLVIAAGLWGAPAVRAADPAEEARIAEAEALLGRLDGWVAAGKKDDIERVLPRLVKLHNEIRSRTARGTVIDAMGDLLAEESLGGTRMAVAGAFAGIKDPAGAWKQLKRFLPSVKEEACGPFPLRVIQSVGMLAPDAALRALKKLMDDATDANVARYAIQALGKYGWSRHREKVLADLIDTLRTLRPGRTRGGDRGGEAARARYAFLRETLVAALDELTGQKIGDADKWLETAQEHKKRLGDLFTFER